MCIRDRPKAVRQQEEKKFLYTLTEIADKTNDYQTNIILPDLRSDLLCNDDEEITPVSYTHLDVYKRQISQRCY